jgi:glutamine amidotransferase
MLTAARRESALVLAHLRKANPPDIGRAWANTHPFEREMGGSSWVFAHNGKLPGIHEDPTFATRRFLPVGDTDSERAFCFLLERLAEGLPPPPGRISSGQLKSRLRQAVAALSALGELNFLLVDGFHLIAYATGRLHLLERPCRSEGCEDAAVWLATEPLTSEEWKPLPRQSLHVFAMGRRVTAGSRSSPSGRRGVLGSRGYADFLPAVPRGGVRRIGRPRRRLSSVGGSGTEPVVTRSK